MLEKKFRSRIILHGGSGKYYCVEYAYYRVFPLWGRLYNWIPGMCWNPLMESYNTAKQLAQNLCSLKDVEKWHDGQMELQKQYPRVKKTGPKPIQVEYFKCECND